MGPVDRGREPPGRRRRDCLAGGRDLAARRLHLIMVASGHATNPFLYPKIPYDTFKDFTPISLLASSPQYPAGAGRIRRSRRSAM